MTAPAHGEAIRTAFDETCIGPPAHTFRRPGTNLHEVDAIEAALQEVPLTDVEPLPRVSVLLVDRAGSLGRTGLSSRWTTPPRFSSLSCSPSRSIISWSHPTWALVRCPRSRATPTWALVSISEIAGHAHESAFSMSMRWA
jgi:hypothetical protein